MKTINQNELVKVNRYIWENDIREEMNKWKSFSQSCFCNTKEDKKFVSQILDNLREMLETLSQENGLTENQIQWFLYTV